LIGSAPASPSTVAASKVATVLKVEPNKTATGNRPQLLNVIEEHEAKMYAASQAWIAQEKHDGVRQMIFRKAGKLGASNKLGFEIPGERMVMGAFQSIETPFIVDGELVGETFYAFDLLELGGRSLKHGSYQERYAMLKTFLPQHPNVVLVESHVGNPGIIDLMRAKGAEGVVFKKASSTYQAGRPNSGGDHFKFKFVNTASFIVSGKNGDKRSVSLTLLDGKIQVSVGSCTIPTNYSIPATGEVVEARYLYAYRGGSIFQPCYLGERNDIMPDECQMSQLKFKGEGY
jgi:bifunctional non-homologous end joining protein LigD